MSFKKLQVGDLIDVRFNGSRTNGNEPYSERALTVVEKNDENITLHSPEMGDFEIYFFERRWRYGSSAEVITLTDVLT